MTLTMGLIVFAGNAWAGNVGSNDAARLVQGVNASVRYQLYQSNQSTAPQKIDIAMAPVLGAIKNGLIAGVATTDLIALHQAALSNALTVVTNLSPEEQELAMIDFLKDFKSPGQLGLDLVKTEFTAYNNLNSTSPQLSRSEVIIPLQPLYVQLQVNKYYLTQMAEAHDLAASNSYFAQSFDQIFQNDLGASITDSATTILNNNLNIPGYFRTSANADGSLSVDVAGLELVYSSQTQVLNQDSTTAINLASQVDQAQRPGLLSGATPSQIIQSVPPALQSAVQMQYQSIKQDLATASAGITLASNLAGFFNKQTQQEISTYGNAAIQFTSAANELANGTLTLASSMSAASNVTGAVLAVYNLLQGGPSQNSAVQAQLAALGQQINQLRTQMNARFDIIDKNLNILFQTINTDFNVVIPALSTLIHQLSDLQGNLNLFEQNFYSLEIEGFLSNLDSAITGCIAFQQIYGNTLPFQLYAGPIGCENTFYIWGTQNAATLATIPGSRLYDDAHVYQELLLPPSGSPDLDNFIDSSNIDYFSQYPAQRFGLPPLAGSLLANPSVWGISAEAYLQLGRENPAYDATLLPSRAADIIAQGTVIQSAVANVVSASASGGHPLFDNLFSNYLAALGGMQTAISSFDTNYNNNQIQNGTQSVVGQGMTRCDGGSLYLNYTVLDITPAIANIAPDYFIRGNAEGSGSLRTCFDAAWVATGTSNPLGPLYAIVMTIHFKYTPQNQAEQEAFAVSWVSDINFIDPVSNNLNIYYNVCYYWNTPPAGPGGHWRDKVSSNDIQEFPCSHHGDVVRCDPQGQQLAAATSSQVSQTATAQVVAQFSQTNSAIQNAATVIAGTKGILERYIEIGLPRSVRSNDHIRSLVFGSQGLPGRTTSGQDEIIAVIGAQASQPNIDVVSGITPRVNSLQSEINLILSSIDSKAYVEFDDTLNSVLQSLRNYYDAKVANSVSTPAGSGVNVQTQQNVSVTFASVSQAGVTVTTRTTPAGAFGVTGGFVVTPQLAFDVETTAVYVGPVTTCFTITSINDPTAFAALVIYHFENGTLVDRTASRDFPSRTICATTSSLSPFQIGVQQPVKPGEGGGTAVVLNLMTPSPIVYGIALTSNQLNATVTPNVPGIFTYNPPLGTVLPAGAQTLSVSFIPTDLTNFTTAAAGAVITVNPAPLAAAANNASRPFGVANPVFSGSVTGAVNGDAFAETFSTTATTGSPVGSYSIVPSLAGASLSNYTLTLQDGTLTITLAQSSLQLSSSAAGPVTDGASVTFTATAASATTGVPTGTVTFLNGQRSLATVVLSQGVAMLTTATLPPGSNSITASYSGDTNFMGSTSSAQTVSVNPPDYSVSVNTKSLTLTAGQSGVVAITIGPLGYTGMVKLDCGALPSYISCSFDPSNSVTVAGTTSTTVQLSVHVASTIATLEGKRFVLFATTLPLSILGLLGAFRRTGRRRLLFVAILVLGWTAGGVMTGCAGGKATKLPPAGAQTIMLVTSGSGGISHQIPLQITVTN